MNAKLRKLVDVYGLVSALKGAGMDAGYCKGGDTSYELIRFRDGSFIWALNPEHEPGYQKYPELTDEELLGWATLAEISGQ